MNGMRMEEEIYSIFYTVCTFTTKNLKTASKRDLMLNIVILDIDCPSSNYTGWNRANCNFLRFLVNTG